ncbi:penicillin-binding transpeptidase domain-containing protein [Paraglaciecola sp. MB-3u-78]|uniref:penicillin-binding transpeptidase domain-containing protein n=1 Tax=Paraglaciecola sp. MB-3u-78 TaxID=2058332 RepID=UPI000C32C60A|nr:penicillin-binding transpeptidase domain-containing protein [Paraglaciecola sp. MB-3u-78]PKG93332.1 peptidoglycan glycosyltransferase FtsI [Paraglaciecola sp. MB-3u-78]
MSRVSANSKNKSRTSQAKVNSAPSLLHWRFVVVVTAILMVFIGLGVRAAYIQVVSPDLLIQQGDNRTMRTRVNPLHRGLIVDRNGQQLAVSVPVRAIWADPKAIAQSIQETEEKAKEDPSFDLQAKQNENSKRWQALAEVLGQNLDELKEKVGDPERRFVYLQRQVSPAMAEYVEELKIAGIYLRDESRRYYPSGEVSAHVVGFTNVDDTGIEGVEKLYNKWLAGTQGSRKIRRDGKGRMVELIESEAGKKSQNIQLTIDQRIQALAYKELKQAVQYYKATSGSAVVVAVNTGEILALVNSPSYNPNNRSGVSAHRIRNRAVTDAYEPGSSVKPLAVLSALEFGTAKADSLIDTSPGWMHLGGNIVRDPRNYGEIDLTQIIRKSSNMGISKLALSVPKEFLLDMYYNVGLMSDSGANLLGESSGIFNNRHRWSDFELSTLSFGYGISVTALQLAKMYSILGDGGIKRPLSIVKPDKPVESERVISANSTKQVLHMMESVLKEGGSAEKASVPGYRVAGKTGTSRKANANGYGDEYVNIFAGVAPVSDPQLAVVILINEPKGELYYAGLTAAPVFAKIMAASLQMLNVPPDDKTVSSLAGTSVDVNKEAANAG